MIMLRVVLVLALAWLALPAKAQVEGADYVLLRPAQTPATASKIEVIEFFSFGCPHCAAMYPLLTEWARTLPANAVLVKVPLSLGRQPWGQLSRAFYTLEAMGELERLEGPLFQALHEAHQQLYGLDQLAAWVGDQGVNAREFRSIFNSPEVSDKAMAAEQMSRNYRIGGVPALTVDGKYLVRGDTHEVTLNNARRLIDMAAAQHETPAISPPTGH